MKSRFGILFSIEVLHNYFGTGRWNEIKVIPMPETELLLKQLEFTTRQIGNEFLVIVKTDSSGKIFHEPASNQKFSFQLIPQTPNYLNFSNLPAKRGEVYLYHFNNLNGNEYGGKHFLSTSIPHYSADALYQPGDFALAPDGNIYEAIVNGSNNTPDDTNSTSHDFWFKHDALQFVNPNDFADLSTGTLIPLEQTSAVYNFKTSVRRMTHSINVYDYNFTSTKFDTLVYSDEVKTDDADGIDLVQVNLLSLCSGKYKIVVSDELKFVYLNLSDNASNIPMLIDIFNLTSNQQSLLDNSKKPQNKKFTIAFASRRVKWRYKTLSNAINEIKDTAGDFLFVNDGEHAFISVKPIPFSGSPIKTLVARTQDGNEIKFLPNPLTDRLLSQQNGIFKTESYINL